MEQNAHAALELADRGYLLRNGVVIASGTSAGCGTTPPCAGSTWEPSPSPTSSAPMHPAHEPPGSAIAAAHVSAAGAPASRERLTVPATPHPDVVRLVAQFAAAGVQTYDTMSVPHARAVLEGVTRVQLPPPQGVQVRDLLVPGAAGLLPARVYHPGPTRPLPVVVYLHGGGWVLGSIRSADGPCRRLAQESGCVVVSVAYRLAPETKFPGPLDDCVSAVRWLGTHAAEVGGDGARLALLGDSAGGNLVAATTLVLRDEGGPRVDAQVLLYPVLSPARANPFPSYEQNADGPLMTRREMHWFWDHYLRDEADEADPRAVPLAAGDLSGLPAATVVVCELDLLRDEGLAYADRLRDAGVDVSTTVYPGAAHGFWWMDAVMAQAGELTAQIAPVLRGR